MPNINVYRPCDVVETAEAWQLATKDEHTPSILALSRQSVPTLRMDSTENKTAKGGYIISASEGVARATLIATGTEVSMAVAAQKQLKNLGIEVNVVSMPCQELFNKQSAEYKQSVLGNTPRIAIEAGSTFGWERYVGDNGAILGIDSFGVSGKGDEVYEHFDLTIDKVVETIKKFL